MKTKNLCRIEGYLKRLQRLINAAVESRFLSKRWQVQSLQVPNQSIYYESTVCVGDVPEFVFNVAANENFRILGGFFHELLSTPGSAG